MADQQDNIAALAKSAFAAHRMKRGPGKSWRFATPGTGFYSFRVTWTPGAVTVIGDIGTAVYQVWPSFSTLWGAITLIDRAGHDYLTGKSGAREVFDRDATVAALIKQADDATKFGDFASWKKLVDHYCPEKNPSNLSARMRAAKALREDEDLTAEATYHLTGDFEDPRYAWPAEACWCFEAVKLWAATMLATEPAWHRAWRWLQRQQADLKSYKQHPVVWQPDLWTSARGATGRTVMASAAPSYR